MSTTLLVYRLSFIGSLESVCSDVEMDLDVSVIFDVLYANSIIVERNGSFCFKFSYWIFYFAAHRMHDCSEFSKYVLTDMRYASYPELIEFYTGIDRKRDDALIQLTKDLRGVSSVVDSKCGVDESFNIYDFSKWSPSEKAVEAMKSELVSGALSSNLPDEIKDNYVDQAYDRSRPLSQGLHSILEEYSLVRLMRGISAASTALRNSDYSKPSLRHELLSEICGGWEKLIQVLVLMSPALAKDGYAQVDGAGFYLTGDIKNGTQSDVVNKIISALPNNIMRWYKNDFFSKKMAPLLYKYIDSEERGLSEHLLNLFVINKRPKGWEARVERFIQESDKNSFYLYDVYRHLRSEYEYSTTTIKNLDKLGDLIKMTAVKHERGVKRPGIKAIKKVPDSILPDRNPA